METPKIPNKLNSNTSVKQIKIPGQIGVTLFTICIVISAIAWFVNMNTYSGNPFIGLVCLLLVPLFICAVYLSLINSKLKVLMQIAISKKDSEKE